MNLMVLALTTSLGINLIMFLPAYFYKTDKLTDLSYAATFAVLAAIGYFSSDRSRAQLIAYYMVLIWAARLGSFLYIRISKKGQDSRFDKLRDDFWAFGRFWLSQGITAFIVLLAAISLWEQSTTALTLTSYLGLGVFLLGLTMEAIADAQKLSFNNKGPNQKWIDIGLWRATRHPNYLGEILVWLGMYFFAFPSLPGSSAIVGLISPLYITILLVFVSGVPLVEKSADRKWGKDVEYQQYKQEVPVLVPTAKSLKRLIYSYLS